MCECACVHERDVAADNPPPIDVDVVAIAPPTTVAVVDIIALVVAANIWRERDSVSVSERDLLLSLQPLLVFSLLMISLLR